MENRKPDYDTKIKMRKLKNLLKNKEIPVKAKKVIENTKKTSKWSWKKIDGYKTLIGVLITGAGIGINYLPILSFLSKELIWIGIGMIITGIGFKIKKGSKDKIMRIILEILKRLRIKK